ncbi:uncharacterized protein LOC129956975 [Argiope bruennichi]|uniref:uncharacterized protein LOC129956975 n=1 Tax=Argiope bruennichi TaxID=94029 RepID=UPI002494D7AD|nr:uncharacterized protein LOC129956975 [Argiope bruennichi]XP_055925030.1 uncharacterized protein LOC129956975 [Argiope bruennichi]
MSVIILPIVESMPGPSVSLLPRAINFYFCQSLQDIALTKIAVLICTSSEMVAFRKNFRSGQFNDYLFLSYHDDRSHENLKRVKEKSIEMCSRLSLPQDFKEKVLSMVVPITVEIETWINDHKEIIYPAFDCQNYFYFKSEGLIDREKTIDILLKLETLPFYYRFRLACLYCKEDDARYFWSNMSADGKNNFNSTSYDHNSILGYWQAQFNLKRKDLRLNTYIGRKKFFFNTFITNVSAMQYLWNMFRKRYCLYHREEGEFLKSHLERSYMYPDIIHFYLEELDNEHRCSLQFWAASDIGKGFLNWPYQNMFLNLKEFRMEADLKRFLDHILREKIVPKCEDYNYFELMKTIWERISPRERSHLKSNPARQFFQAILFALNQESTELLTKEWLQQMDIEMRLQYDALAVSARRVIYH